MDHSLDAPYNGPQPWRGSIIRYQPEQWTIHLKADEIEELQQAVNHVLALGIPTAEITTHNFHLPNLTEEICSWRARLTNQLGFILVKGLDINGRSIDETEKLFFGLGLYLGNPRAQNAQGQLLGHVRDQGLNSSDPNVRIYQTSERQTFHTDSADVVGLLCLNKARLGGQSLVVNATTIYQQMHAQAPHLAQLLTQPIATDRRGEVAAGEDPYVLIPVFSQHDGYLTIFYQRQYIESAQRFKSAPRLTSLHYEALDLFDAIANDPDNHLTMDLEPGDIQFVYNHAMLHDRQAFTDWPDPRKKRHLLRLWLSLPNDRPLPEVFASRFGKTTIGDRGGISVSSSEGSN